MRVRRRKGRLLYDEKDVERRNLRCKRMREEDASQNLATMTRPDIAKLTRQTGFARLMAIDCMIPDETTTTKEMKTRQGWTKGWGETRASTS